MAIMYAALNLLFTDERHPRKHPSVFTHQEQLKIIEYIPSYWVVSEYPPSGRATYYVHGAGYVTIGENTLQFPSSASCINPIHRPAPVTVANMGMNADNACANPTFINGYENIEGGYEFVNINPYMTDGASTSGNADSGEIITPGDLDENNEEQAQQPAHRESREDDIDYLYAMKSLTYMDEVFMPKYLRGKDEARRRDGGDRAAATAGPSMPKAVDVAWEIKARNAATIAKNLRHAAARVVMANTATANAARVRPDTVKAASSWAGPGILDNSKTYPTTNSDMYARSNRRPRTPIQHKLSKATDELEEALARIEMEKRMAELQIELDEMLATSNFDIPATAENSDQSWIYNSESMSRETAQVSGAMDSSPEGNKSSGKGKQPMNEVSADIAKHLPKWRQIPSRLAELARFPSCHNLTLEQKAKFHDWSMKIWTGHPDSEAEGTILPDVLEWERLRYASGSK